MAAICNESRLAKATTGPALEISLPARIPRRRDIVKDILAACRTPGSPGVATGSRFRHSPGPRPQSRCGNAVDSLHLGQQEGMGWIQSGSHYERLPRRVLESRRRNPPVLPAARPCCPKLARSLQGTSLPPSCSIVAERSSAGTERVAVPSLNVTGSLPPGCP